MQNKALAGHSANANLTPPPAGWFMPAEWVPHDRCWMSFPHRLVEWGDSLPAVRAAITRLALAIRQFEPVSVVVSPSDVAEARQQLGPTIDIVPLAVDDLWMRDIGPTFLVKPGAGVSAAQWRFNVWGEKFPGYDADRSLAERLLTARSVTAYPAPIVTEGGALHVDGEGTLLVTETSVLNANRNPGLDKREAETIFRHWLGIEQVIWLPGSTVETITDGHIDGFACFTRPGQALAELPASDQAEDAREMQENLRALRLARDAKGRSLEIGLLRRPGEVVSDTGWFCDCYVNFYIANGGIVMPRFGDDSADQAAAEMVARAFPGRRVTQVDIAAIAEGGGGIHCSTQQQPAFLPILQKE